MTDPTPHDLGPCPFCRGDAQPVGDVPGTFAAECMTCGARSGVVEAQSLEAALPQLRRMWNRRLATDPARKLVCRLTLMLYAADDALRAAAQAEERRERGKSMRQITAQERAKNARELVFQAVAWLEGQG